MYLKLEIVKTLTSVITKYEVIRFGQLLHLFFLTLTEGEFKKYCSTLSQQLSTKMLNVVQTYLTNG